MKTTESKGFFCVVYFTDTKKTCFYHKVDKPFKLAKTLQNWKWIKSYINKQDYYGDPKANNYYAIFDDENPITEFNFKQVSK